MIYSGCPGTAKLKTPVLEERICPECGGVIEIFSTDTEVKCDNCGFVAYNDMLTCAQWCKYARQCVGEELYNRFHKNEE